MKKGWICALALILALGGCAGLRQFPEKSDGSDAEILKTLDATYDEALTKLYDPDNSAIQTKIRNEFIERRLAVLDAQFLDFVRDLSRDNANADLLVALAGVGAGGAGALVSESASQILSAISGGLAGGKAAYDKAVLYDNAITALIAQMAAGRQQIAARIFGRWQASVDDYPLWLARQDIADYELAGSLPGAIIATAEDAKDKAEEAEEVLQVRLPALTEEAFTMEAFESVADLDAKIADLGGAEAKTLIVQIEGVFPGEQEFIQALYPTAERTADSDGSKAKETLRLVLEETALTKAGIETWERLIKRL